MRERISRRTFVRSGVTGLAVAVPLGLLAKKLGFLAKDEVGRRASGQQNAPVQMQPTGAKDSADSAAAQRDQAMAQLVAPIAVGTRLGSTSVAAIGVDARGLGVVTLTDEHGRRWDAELARRTPEDSALNPLARSNRYSLYLRNGGSGSKPTDESVGRAVFAIANSVKRNEDAVSTLTLASRTEVWASTGYQPSQGLRPQGIVREH